MVFSIFATTTTGAPFGTRQATSLAAGTKPGILRIKFQSSLLDIFHWESILFLGDGYLSTTAGMTEMGMGRRQKLQRQALLLRV